MGVNMTDVYVMLKPRSEWSTAHDREGLVEAFDKKVTEAVPGAGFAYTQPIEMNTNDFSPESKVIWRFISTDTIFRFFGNTPTRWCDRSNTSRVRATCVLSKLPGSMFSPRRLTGRKWRAPAQRRSRS